jgi:hypothetical protein
MYSFLKRVCAGLRRAGKAPSSPAPVWRCRPGVECLEERLALSSSPNLVGDVFVLKDPAGKAAGMLTITTEDTHTGVFTATFLDLTNNHDGGTDSNGGGKIGLANDNRASILFVGNHVGGLIHQSLLIGSVKGERHDASIKGSLVVLDLTLLQSGLVTGGVVPTAVTGHA